MNGTLPMCKFIEECERLRAEGLIESSTPRHVPVRKTFSSLADRPGLHPIGGLERVFS